MYSIVHDETGLIHLLSAVLALISGTLILCLKKGTSLHKKAGYVYAVSMLVVNITAFLIYRLFGRFGIFHFAALVSLITVIGGMVPVLLRKPKDWLTAHYSFMYWSVLGLYAAFVSETLTRIPETPFFGMVGTATGIIMFTGGTFFYWRKNYWEKLF